MWHVTWCVSEMCHMCSMGPRRPGTQPGMHPPRSYCCTFFWCLLPLWVLFEFIMALTEAKSSSIPCAGLARKQGRLPSSSLSLLIAYCKMLFDWKTMVWCYTDSYAGLARKQGRLPSSSLSLLIAYCKMLFDWNTMVWCYTDSFAGLARKQGRLPSISL